MPWSVRSARFATNPRSRSAARRARRQALLGLLLVWSVLAGSFQTAPSANVAAAAAAPTGAGTPPKRATSDPIPPPAAPGGLPTPAPTVTPPPDTNYVDQAIAADWQGDAGEAAALPTQPDGTTSPTLDPTKGGRVSSADRRFHVSLRPGAVPASQPLTVAVTRPTFGKGDPRASRGGHPLAELVELTATAGKGGPKIPHFERDALLEWTLDPATLTAAGVRGFPRVYTFNETTQTWDEILSYWDPTAHRLLARTPHFSLYAVGDGFDAVNNYIPTINNFEVNLQSGTATVNYPLNLPAGPGGLGPKVSLSYNSGATDRVDPGQQGPSNVGWGWTLSMNYIAATQHNYGSYHPWTASITSDGANGDLIKGSDGYWHTAQEGFARIQYFAGSGNHHDDWWEAWDGSGTHYVFDLRALALDSDNLTNGAATLVTNRWMLHTVTDVHGNTITYSYYYQSATNTPPTLPTTSPITTDITKAVYPYQIQWGATDGTGAKLQAGFNLSSRTIGTTSDATTPDRTSGYVQDWRVDRVDVSRKQAGSGNFALLRAYRFSQDYSITITGANSVSYPHLTLTGITPVGNDNSTTLPPTTFLYYDGSESFANVLDDGHLYQAQNGYGGETRYYYDAAGNGITSAYRRVRARRLLDGLDGTANTVHNVAYYYDYRGAVLNTVEQSDETNAQYPLHSARNEFRGFAYVRVTDPMNQATDHYFSQNDANKAQEWRVQTGRTISVTDELNTAPPSGNWTTSGSVIGTTDPGNSLNGVWKLGSTGGTLTRANSVTAGSTVDARILVGPQGGSGNSTFNWLLENASGNGEYWGLQFYTVSGVVYPKAVWHLWNGSAWVDGTRDLSPNATLRPKYAGGLSQYPASGAIWYRVQLHPGSDSRFAVELYRDDQLGGYSSVHSGEPADSGTIPNLQWGQAWRFKGQVSPTSGTNWVAWVDNYHETRPVYSENNTVYTAQSLSNPATGWAASAWVGTTNNTGGMTIRFVPAAETWTTEVGAWATNPGGGRTTHTTQVYDSYGQVISQYLYGDWFSSDDRSVHTAYIRDTTRWIINKPLWVNTYKTITGNTGGSNFIAQTYYGYDGYGYGTLGTKGDLTTVWQANLLAGATQGPSSATQYSYDTFGNLLQTLDPNGHGPLTGYDPYYYSFPITTTYPNNRSETMAYTYTLDVPITITDVNGLVTERRYDALGRPARTWNVGYGTDSAPNESYNFPDLNQTSVTPPFYISLSTLTGTGSTSTWATRWFDGRGRTMQDVTPKDSTHQIVVNRTYTMTGQIYTATLPYAVNLNSRFAYSTPDTTKPGITTYYDGIGRMAQTVNADGTSVSHVYSGVGWQYTYNETGTKYQLEYIDALGQLAQTSEQDVTVSPLVDVRTDYAYDLLGHQTSVTRSSNGTPTTTTMTYDGLGRKATMTDPDMGYWTYGYDPAGNLTWQQDALYNSTGGSTTYPTHRVIFDYDNMNRPTAKYYGQAHKDATTPIPDVKYYYDNDLGDAASKYSWGKLRLAEVTVQGQGTTNANGHAYEYDLRGLTTAEVVTTTATSRVYRTSSTFDVGGRPTTLTYPDSTTNPEVVTYGYNTQATGLPVSLTSNVSGNPAPVYNATYNDRAQLLTLQQGGTSPTNNLLTSSFTYDDTTTKRGWLTNITVMTSTTTLNETFGYSANGNITSISQSASGTNNPTFSNTYTYDGFDRLKTATGTLFASETYNFDTLGRMTTRVIGGSTKTYTYGDSAHKDAPTGYNGATYSYDANGSQTGSSGPGTGMSQSRTFDPEGRMTQVISVTSSNQTTSKFVYDANGGRLLKIVTVEDGVSKPTSTTTLYVGAYEEQIGSGYINYYTFGGKGVGLRRSGWASGNGQYRLVGDQLGSTTLLVDTATPPSVTQRQYHKPYGEIAWQWTASGSLTSVGFTGQRLDSDSGLMYYGARFYDPALGYFASADTIGVDKDAAQSRNRYAYVLNNPIKNADPTGHCVDANQPGVPSEYTCTDAENDFAQYAIRLEGDWTLAELWSILQGIEKLRQVAGWSVTDFKYAMGWRPGPGPFGGRGTVLVRKTEPDQITKDVYGVNGNPAFEYYNGLKHENVIEFYGAYGTATGQLTSKRAVHEFAHAWDSSSDDDLGLELMFRTGSGYYFDTNKKEFAYNSNHPTSSYSSHNHYEDFAESVAALVYPSFYTQYPTSSYAERSNIVNEMFTRYRR